MGKQVSFLKPTNMDDPFAWVDDVLHQAGIVPTVPERGVSRAEVRLLQTGVER